jgi:molybdate transport system substrate-binding protein
MKIAVRFARSVFLENEMKFYYMPLLVGALLASTSGIAAEPVKVLAAGSLTGAMTAAIELYKHQTGETVQAGYGPAGILLERIEGGEPVDIYASANMAHPRSLAAKGVALTPVVLARNRICARALPGFGLTSQNLLDRMLDPKVHVATSTPKADPGGDYAWSMFEKADSVRPGATATLKAKAMQLVGGKNSPVIPEGKNAIDYFFEQRKIDISISYCSSRETTPDARYTTVSLPPNLAITADYGLTVLTKNGANREAALRFALFLLTPEVQHLLSLYGFEAVTETRGDQ